tara:strand:- start:524 stop:790 length:267 start_codon:yes stop_codon:yes gene_type:complete
MEKEYLYHCSGCQKSDKDFPDKETRCEHTGELYVPRCTPLTYHKWARSDAYGIYTGLYCDKCYKHNYPYKRGRYHDESYCGERIEPNE